MSTGSPIPLRFYYETPLCLMTLIVVPLSFVSIKCWSIKNKKFRQILYISSATSLIISAFWTIDLILLFFGNKNSIAWWSVHLIRFWLAASSVRLLMFIYFILVLILLKKLSMSQVKVAYLAIASALIGLVTIGEIVYVLCRYHLSVDDGQYHIDFFSADLKTDLIEKIWNGAATLLSLLEVILLLGSFMYVKYSTGLERRSPMIQSAISILRRLIPVYLSYYIPVALVNILSFINIYLPDSFLPDLDFITRAITAYKYTLTSYLPIMIKWAIRAPPPPPPRRCRRNNRLRTIVAIPPATVIREGDEIRTVLGASQRGDIVINLPAEIGMESLLREGQDEGEGNEEEQEEEERNSALEYFQRMEAAASNYFNNVFRIVPVNFTGPNLEEVDDDLDFEALEAGSDSGLGGGGGGEGSMEMDDLFRDAPPEGDIFPDGLM